MDVSAGAQRGSPARMYRLLDDTCGFVVISLTRYQQEAELKTLRAELPEYADIHSHILQDVLARLEKTYQAFFRRLANGEKPRAVGFPRFHGMDRYHSFYLQGVWQWRPAG